MGGRQYLNTSIRGGHGTIICSSSSVCYFLRNTSLAPFVGFRENRSMQIVLGSRTWLLLGAHLVAPLLWYQAISMMGPSLVIQRTLFVNVINLDILFVFFLLSILPCSSSWSSFVFLKSSALSYVPLHEQKCSRNVVLLDELSTSARTPANSAVRQLSGLVPSPVLRIW